MARRPSNRSRIEQLTDEFEPQMRAAFLDAVADITSRAELGRIVERLEKGDIAGAVEAVHLDPAAYSALDRTITSAFDAGGRSAIGALPKLRDPSGGEFIVRWDARNLRAETWLRQHSSTLITRITDDQRNAVRRALVEGMEAGRNPRATALDVIGRINRATGRRTGGIVGLTSQLSTTVEKARAAMISGDVDGMRAYLSLGLRDHRFDASVRKAIAAGKPVPQDLVPKITGRLTDRYLDLRGKAIAKTETMAALNQSGVEAMYQAIDAGAVKVETVTKVWHTARDPRVRDSHAALDRESVGIGAAFSNGLAYPGDPSAPASETVNCRCWMETKIDFFAGYR